MSTASLTTSNGAAALDPAAIDSSPGVAGLARGGGFGWSSGKFGLTIDNLQAADVVTADGELLHVSQEADPDLFWAIRAACGNFGDVPWDVYLLDQVGAQVLS